MVHALVAAHGASAFSRGVKAARARGGVPVERAKQHLPQYRSGGVLGEEQLAWMGHTQRSLCAGPRLGGAPLLHCGGHVARWFWHGAQRAAVRRARGRLEPWVVGYAAAGTACGDRAGLAAARARLHLVRVAAAGQRAERDPRVRWQSARRQCSEPGGANGWLWLVNTLVTLSVVARTPVSPPPGSGEPPGGTRHPEVPPGAELGPCRGL